MKHIARLALAVLLLALSAASACAQTITMEDIYVAFNYPDSWFVVSPQLALVYAPVLEDAGIDAEALSIEMTQQGVASRAYNADFSECLSILTLSDDLSGEIFDMKQVTEAQRKTMRSRAQNNQLFETTGLRTQDLEWQIEGGVYYLYIHYTKTFGDQIVGRGVRYMTVRNGMYVVLDWQISGRRFTNRDLNAFRKRIADLTVLETITEPVRSVKLLTEIPTETSSGTFQITGTATANAGLVVETPNGAGGMETLSVGKAGSNGKFTLNVSLSEEGAYDITLTATSEGMNASSVSGQIVYDGKTLPVSIGGVPEDGVVTTDTVKITGQTLAGVQIQLVTPYGMTKKRANNDGSFSFELTTKEADDYDYTVICTKDGYDTRRVQFTLTRVVTDMQERERIKATAEKISYKNLQGARSQDQGKVMCLYGPVTQIDQGGANTYIRMDFNKGADGVWFNPVVIVTTEETGVKVGDMLTAVVTVSGTFEEQDDKGNAVAVPRFELMFVDKIE